MVEPCENSLGAPKAWAFVICRSQAHCEQIWAETWTPLKGHSYSESELSRQKDLNSDPGFATYLLLNLVVTRSL